VPVSRLASSLAAAALLAAAPAGGQALPPASPIEHSDPVTPGTPPAVLKLDPFYTQYLDAGGIPVLASPRAPAKALVVVRDIIVAMLANRPDLHAALAARGYRVVVMAQEEGTLDLPEQRGWKKPAPDDPRLTPCERKHYDIRIGALTDAEYWNRRARGMGGPITSAGTENLLGIPGTRYFGENIFVHEFSHDILQVAPAVDPALFAEVARAYADAMTAGRWTGEYAAVSINEYWAVGTQIWFNTARLIAFDGHVILTDRDLEAYDPALYRALARVYGANHRIPADAFYRSPARIPNTSPPRNTAEIC
jgi:hypothetical protein